MNLFKKQDGLAAPLVLTILALFIAGAGLFYYFKLYKGSAPKTTSSIDTVRIGLKSAPLGFYGQKDIEYESPTFNFNSNIFEGLTTFTKDLKFASRQLVESWDNPSDTVWRLRLKKGVKFHNGYDFTAEDAKYSIDFAKQYVVKDDIAQVKQVRIMDPFTIEIETNGPSPLLLNNLINVFVLSKKYSEENGFDKPNGTGPYKFVENINGKYQLAANENYYLGAPKIKTAIYRVIEDDNSRIDALLSGDVDLVEDVPAARIGDISVNKKYTLKGVPSLRVIYLGMDVSSPRLKSSSATTNPFKKLDVRKAIYAAIDEDQIIRTVMGNHAYPATQLATSVNFGFNPNITRPSVSIDSAKILLAQAGFADGFDVTLDVPNNRYQNDELIGKAVAEQLGKIGIRVKLNAMPKEGFFPKVTDQQDTDFYLLGWSQENGDAGGAYATIIHTPSKDSGYGSFNVGKYSNPVIDDLIQKSDNTVDSVARLRILQEIAKLATDDVAVIPLHQQEDSFVVNRSFDWTPRRDNGIRAFEISAN
ncbi:hypothetical protein A2631_02165 [Candidatus Daviesbacteria bacterium RIFCSPHIGHO2_01_FULL_44_29]|uniref:Solute-binding protein family 5 domain-containing protein n=1 Tax=Candidatus Daviesbacteria bacterium RIFCSPHIGHO2_02_FULL_43_12 TaxID=1797776 RepID=A0A1F5KK43_9BACT|nr:MAG: hypothetical protein A2631_02165 [Candidatus Daviesbacteria bacterium RIFCSPHIGHO2_01_FULL_44_29]OGE39525.1 MAG: hypothetical protein A3E86_01735 [Candidatus Daviesbacteria bacterium RIFCSPHIGHO2_12_FULL_47_45]OGE41199.1 MAG: hypothetical protein A3D25_01560 [Candidatus Daviesbacteria bacterium RIFCSPHIGHO2_02_FULL_43_12]OGE69398.1 MAG: hypothetical protein A3B55_03300 [Candidatus Daviesbacteria bacterium RIFCSPLOWO2_01_FULL_43_15]